MTHLNPDWNKRYAEEAHNADAHMGEIQCTLPELVQPNQNKETKEQQKA